MFFGRRTVAVCQLIIFSDEYRTLSLSCSAIFPTPISATKKNQIVLPHAKNSFLTVTLSVVLF